MLKDIPQNRNSKRSIILLTEVLLELLKTNSLCEISISQLTQTAGLARNTFYAHFETKENVLSHHMYTLFNDKVKAVLDKRENQYEDFDLLYFEMWSENRDFLKLLERDNLLHLLNRFSHYLDSFCEEYFQAMDCNISELAVPYVNSAYATVLGSIIVKWLTLDFVHTPQELRTILREIIK